MRACSGFPALPCPLRAARALVVALAVSAGWAAGGLGASAALAQGTDVVDVELVLAADGSGSIDDQELRFQREGYAQALASGPVQEAIRRGRHGRIAVLYLEWGGAGSQHVIADWSVIHDVASAEAFGQRLVSGPRLASGWNSISGAIDASARAIRDNAFRGERLVIDVSADGGHYGGRPVQIARDEAVAAGITINGLVIQPPDGRLATRGIDLTAHFEADVIGGYGAFVVAAEDRRNFLAAVMAKLVREIAGPAPGPTRAEAGPVVR